MTRLTYQFSSLLNVDHGSRDVYLVFIENHDSLLNGFWKFHCKFVVHFLGPRA